MDARTRTAAIERIRGLCDDLVRIAPDDLAAVAGEVRGSVGEPLRVAVVGRVKAGKSTLVNALIGAKTAATNATECTRIVTWYRFGIAAPTQLVLRDGTVRALPLSGRVPEELPVPVEEVSHAVVYLQEQALQDMTLIDTPGLETSTAAHDQATRRAVLGIDAVSTADAILYVFRRTDHSDDLAFVREFHRTAGFAPGIARSIGVLSCADVFGAGPWGPEDPIDAAETFAAEMAARHGELFGAVVTVAGRMAEAARTGEVREADARALARLADLDDLDLQDLESEQFEVAQVDADALTRVLANLRGYPLRYGRATAAGGAAALSRWLLARSGYSALAKELRERYVGLGVQLTVRQSLLRLREAARSSPQRSALEELIEIARIDPALHLLREFEAHELLLTRFPGHALIDELERLMSAQDDRQRLGLLSDVDDAEVHATARRRASDHVAGAALASDSEAYTAHLVLAQSYRLLAGRRAI